MDTREHEDKTEVHASESPVNDVYHDKANDGLGRNESPRFGTVTRVDAEGQDAVAPEVLEHAVDILQTKNTRWYAYFLTREFWFVIALGSVCLLLNIHDPSDFPSRQILALCITGTNTFSTLLVNKGTSIPAFQTLLNYVLLTAIYTTYTIYKYGPKKYFKILMVDGWKYICLSFLDVEGNYFTVLAYRCECLFQALLCSSTNKIRCTSPINPIITDQFSHE